VTLFDQPGKRTTGPEPGFAQTEARVEHDMKTLTLILGILLMTATGPQSDASAAQSAERSVLTDLTSLSSALSWYVVNDNVMGGRSNGGVEVEQGVIRFAGRTNTNGGGFSSIRTQPLQLDLSEHTGIQLRVKGDGRRYTWRLATEARWRGRQISYWAEFDTRDGVWTVVDIPFASFVPKFRGSLLDGPALDRAKITGMGLMIYDEQDGPFELQLSSVGTFREEPEFALGQFQWKNRVLVVSAPSADDANLRAQLDALELSDDEFELRDMVLVKLVDAADSMAAERRLNDAEVSLVRATLGIEPQSFAVRLIGKDGSVKLENSVATSMAEIYGLIDSMPMRRREMLDND